ncbi:MAG: hypothetical protein AB7O97_02440 [Planctomycetota bacterium]
MSNEDDSVRGGAARRWAAVMLGVAALGLWVACDSLVPRQGWDSGLGPVVPHDTFPGDCSTCHTGSDWHTLKSEFEFDHARETGVALHGAHQEVACLMCHNDRGPVAQFAAQGCAGCHADPHRGQLGRTCSDCHDERTWRPTEVIQQHDRTRFPLVGAHAATACFRCHPGAQVGNFAGASPDCEHCHAGEYLRASYDHVANGFLDGCDRCHRPVGWIPAQVQHPASFPLTFGHGNRACTLCHQGSTYSGLSTTCSSCHLDEYQRTGNPPHASNSFSTDCVQCHNTRGWGGGNFQHSARFPLTNGHAGRQCSECHAGGVFTGQSTACATCHLDDYQATANPPHASSGFGTGCEQCHNTRTWGDGTFNHRFPINSGAHRGFNCNECHTVSFPTFSCTHCHEHRQSAMDSEHRGENGYSWNSQRCYDCHPNGRG